jgi:hypothetical protein
MSGDNRGPIGVAGLAFGIGCGLADLGRVLAGLCGLFADDDGGHSRKVQEDKAAWWKSLSDADKVAFTAHEKRKRQYVRLRRRLYAEVRRRCYAEFRRALPPTVGDRLIRQWQIANEVWAEWDMSAWNDVQAFPDWPELKKHIKPSDGGCLDRDQYMAREPVWTPPKWR